LTKYLRRSTVKLFIVSRVSVYGEKTAKNTGFLFSVYPLSQGENRKYTVILTLQRTGVLQAEPGFPQSDTGVDDVYS
jgi:hypothetical protein